jgi:hypothetical protein
MSISFTIGYLMTSRCFCVTDSPQNVGAHLRRNHEIAFNFSFDDVAVTECVEQAATKNPRLLAENAGFKTSSTANYCVLVPLAGIELATFSLRMNCSTN